MLRSFFAAVAVCVWFVSGSVGCSRSGNEEKVSAMAAGHAPADAKPGSYEDWCDEHQVPESQCSLCHPELIAAFKATGDWCAEHSLPESQCRKCNPGLTIARGPKTH